MEIKHTWAQDAHASRAPPRNPHPLPRHACPSCRCVAVAECSGGDGRQCSVYGGDGVLRWW